MVEKCVEAPDSVKFDIFFAGVGQQMELSRLFPMPVRWLVLNRKMQQKRTSLIMNDSEDNFDGKIHCYH